MLLKLIENIVRKLVEKPDGVAVSESESGDKRVIRITVAQADVRRVIGIEGRVFRALKALVFIFSRVPSDLFVEGLNEATAEERVSQETK